MKNLITILALLFFYNISFSQDSVQVTKAGISIVKLKSPHNTVVTHQRILSWVNETYKNPKEVIEGDVEGKGVILKGYSKEAWGYKDPIMGTMSWYDLTYQIKILILSDSTVTFTFIEGTHYTSDHQEFLGSSRSFFKGNGECKPVYEKGKGGGAVATLEKSINYLWFTLYDKIVNNRMGSDEALSELKKAKDKLDLGLITQEEFEKIKSELSKFIK